MTLEKICMYKNKHSIFCSKAKVFAFQDYCENECPHYEPNKEKFLERYCEGVCKLYEPSETEFLESYRGTAGMCLDNEGEF